MEKKTFLFYTSWRKNVEMMDDSELRRFIINLINYSEGKEVDLPTRLEKMVWNDIVEILNFNENKRQKTIERRREAGKKGGAPNGNQNAQKKIEDENNLKQPKTNKTTKDNQNQTKQTKQPDIGYMLKEEGNMLKEESNRINDIKNKLIEIMKQVIEDGYIQEEEVRNWKIINTRTLINEILYDYPNWENDLFKNGLSSFLNLLPKKTSVEVDYILYSTLRAHLIL